MWYAMDRGIASPDQFGAAELRELLPVVLKGIERIAVFEILEGNQPLSEFRTEVSREPAGAHDEAVVAEPVEHPEPLGRYFQAFWISPFPGCQTGQDPVCRAFRKQFPIDVLNP